MAELGKKIATRQSYGEVLQELSEKYDNLIVLDADLAGSTKSGMIKKVHPEMHIDCGIAEANMTVIAAGLSTCGMIPVISTFAMFGAGRSYEQVRNSIGYPHLNVKICCTHAGITVGQDGASHQCLEDLALMREIPGMVVMNPADDSEAKAAIRAAVAYEGPVYIRLGRAAVPVVFPEDMDFEIGEGAVLREGTDVTIAATGVCVDSALKAADKLAEEGISAEVINICTIKPLDTQLLLKSVGKTRKIVTVEEHFVTGGLGSAVAECLAENDPVKMLRIGVKDTFGQSGTADELMKFYGLDADSVAASVKAYLA